MQTSRTVRALVLGAIAVVTIAEVGLLGKPVTKDFVSYWSAGQLVARHGNPYSSEQVLAVEKHEGFPPDRPILMRNPPWAIPVVYGLGFVNLRVGLVLWLAMVLGCVVAFVEWTGIPAKDRILAYVFAPVFACLSSGQSSGLLLLGVTLFLVFHKRRPWAAGVGLALMAFKPHLFLVLGPIVLIDCVRRKNWKALAGGAGVLAVLTGVAMVLDLQVWLQYLAMLRGADLGSEFLQTPAYLLRYAIAPGAVWLQMLPAAIDLTWAVWFYARNRARWVWRVHGLPLLMVTVAVAPYAWLTDEMVLLPAVMAVVSADRKPKLAMPLFLAINAVVLVMLVGQVQLSSGAYVWTSGAWLLWFVLCGRGVRRITGA